MNEESCPFCWGVFDKSCLVKNFIIKKSHIVIPIICEDCFHHHLKNQFNIINHSFDQLKDLEEEQ